VLNKAVDGKRFWVYPFTLQSHSFFTDRLTVKDSIIRSNVTGHSRFQPWVFRFDMLKVTVTFDNKL